VKGQAETTFSKLNGFHFSLFTASIRHLNMMIR
jgi:hypothetical protein